MILVCGGAGYIGSHAVFQLIESGEEVVVIDSLATGHREAVHPDAVFYEVDMRDRESLDQIFSKHKVDAVIHFAAYSLVGESMKQPLKYYDNNLYGTQILLEKMLEHEVYSLVFSSTAAVYGEPAEVPIPETAPTNPTSVYGETKLSMERMIRWVSETTPLRSISLRYFNVAGAYDDQLGEDHQPETHLIPLILKVPLGQKESISIYGDDYDTEDGTCIRDYIHVQDLIQAHILALEKLRNGGGNAVYNLGNGSGFSVKEVIESARRVTGHSIPADIAERRAGDPARLVASAERAKLELGWSPVFTHIDQIVSSAWEWHKMHPNGYRGNR